MLVAALPADAAYIDLGVGGGIYNIRTKTLLDSRYYHIYHQRYDFSCGSAALASLLTFYYGRPTTEDSVIKAMYNAGDHAKISREGFSLLDMKNYLQSIHLKSNGYRASLDELNHSSIPAIALINRKSYMHFVIIQGITQDKVLLGDPALGRKIVDRAAFEKMWNNKILFVIENNVPEARKAYSSEWGRHSRKPGQFFMPIPNTELASYTLLNTPMPNLFH